MPIGITLITIIIKFELFIVTGCNWLPSREGEGVCHIPAYTTILIRVT